MAKKVQATDTQDVNESVPESIKDKLIDSKTYSKAVDAARECLMGYKTEAEAIQAMESEITTRKQGNAGKAFSLAKLCVELTMHKSKADLRKAGIVFRDACTVAEKDTVNAWNTGHPGQLVKNIRQVVPSWPPLRNYLENAMFKAGLNPNDFAGPTKVKEAYSKWIEKNPEQADARGAKPRATDTTTANSRDGKVITGHVENISQAPRHQIALLVKAVEALPKELHNEAAELIARTIKAIGELKAPEEGATTNKRVPAPAREAGRTGASAE